MLAEGASSSMKVVKQENKIPRVYRHTYVYADVDFKVRMYTGASIVSRLDVPHEIGSWLAFSRLAVRTRPPACPQIHTRPILFWLW